MTDSTARQQPAESRLRRWWRSISDAVEAMEISEEEHLAYRIDYLERRVHRLEAMHEPPPSDHASGFDISLLVESEKWSRLPALLSHESVVTYTTDRSGPNADL
jgi:hypothetical protein